MKSAISHHGRWFRNKDSGFWLLWLFAQRCTINYATIALMEVRSDGGGEERGTFRCKHAQFSYTHSWVLMSTQLRRRRRNKNLVRTMAESLKWLDRKMCPMSLKAASLSLINVISVHILSVGGNMGGGAGVTRSDGEKFVTYMYSSYPNYV